MKYVVATVVSMFRLQCLVESSWTPSTLSRMTFFLTGLSCVEALKWLTIHTPCFIGTPFGVLIASNSNQKYGWTRMGILSHRFPWKFTIFQGGAWVFLEKYMAFIHMKYVVETVVSMFILQHLVEYSAMGNPNLIHSLTTHMKGGFPVLLEKKKVD